MTRETKIGLLVGLAFIIIVGILLGDSVRHATDVQPASLPQVAQNVRNAVTTPGTPVTAPITMQSQGGTQNATPQQTVLTREEVLRPQNGGVVIIGPGSASTLQSNTQVGSRGNETSDGAADSGTPPRNVNPNDARTINDPLHQLALQNGEQLVPLGSRPGENTTPRPTRPDNTVALARGGKSYQAGPGDSLGKIAAKFYGSSAKPLRDAIVAANPSLKANPDRILAGQTYTIPAIETAAAPVPTQPAPPLPASRGGSGATAPTEYWYTVKESDNLWRIARDQVGDPGAVAALKELNKEVLKGGETVRINMKLKLPGKPVTAN
jgi:nucleoid-associated protein YgaU